MIALFGCRPSRGDLEILVPRLGDDDVVVTTLLLFILFDTAIVVAPVDGSVLIDDAGWIGNNDLCDNRGSPLLVEFCCFCCRWLLFLLLPADTYDENDDGLLPSMTNDGPLDILRFEFGLDGDETGD